MPQIPPDGLLIYGSGLVFGGNVYPVWMVDGVPMQAAAGAQQAGQQGQSMAQKPVKAPGQQLQKQQQTGPSSMSPPRSIQNPPDQKHERDYSTSRHGTPSPVVFHCNALHQPIHPTFLHATAGGHNSSINSNQPWACITTTDTRPRAAI
ncbi:uncharacterized protein LOC117584542 isoform X1 [Drosophila guanche]|nr:uncharacterized protein LOC117584542 isoform X1 [Drosophila guanche]